MPTATDNEKFKLEVQSRTPDFRANISTLRNRADFKDRTKDTGLVNPDGKNASIRLTRDKVNISGAENSHQKMTKNQALYTSLEEKHITNRMNISTDEVIINGHKLNPNLWEYADFRGFTDMYGQIGCVGGFSVVGTILTPSWDERLKKYVLIRRICRMPLFSPSVNVPEILKTLNIEDPTKVVNDYQVKQETETVEEWYNRVKDKDGKVNEGSAPNAGNGNGDLSNVPANGKIESAVQWAINTANDQSHGYSQGAGRGNYTGSREGPDYDCASFVYYALENGGFGIVSALGYAGDCSTLWSHLNQLGGWQKMSWGEASGSLVRGDILNNSERHVAIYIGNGQTVEARGATYGDYETGDQGDEIGFSSAEGRSWTEVYRYTGGGQS